MRRLLFHILFCLVGECAQEPTVITACPRGLDITLSVQTFATQQIKASWQIKKTSVPLTFIQIIMSFTGSVSLNPPPTHLFLLFGILSFKTQIRGGGIKKKNK